MFLFTYTASAQKVLLDDFESPENWKIFKADGVNVSIEKVSGRNGNAIRLTYDFTKGTGYGGIQKAVSIKLPENFKFIFYLRANSPHNNLEVKFLDSTGENVWWMNNRNFEFPVDWKKFTVKKRHIKFAWGPTTEKSLENISRIEFTIASYNGGKGWVEFDDLQFEELPAEKTPAAQPQFTASSQKSGKYSLKNISDGSNTTTWLSKKSKSDTIFIDFKQPREFGGFIIDWDKKWYPDGYKFFLSDDKTNWENVYSVEKINGGRSYIRLKDAEAKFAQIVMTSNSAREIGINELKILEPGYSEELNKFFINMAKEYPRGYFPRYFYEEASHWTVIGVNSDVKEALINEDGTIEVDKNRFSIEPMLYLKNKLITWNDVNKSQSLEDDYLPMPEVKWEKDKINLKIKSFAAGEANKNSTLFNSYIIENQNKVSISGKLFLLLRPFQVNPYYQWLNLRGGVSSISSINISDSLIKVDDDKYLIPLTKYSSAGVLYFDEANTAELLAKGEMPSAKSVEDKQKLASGVLCYNFDLKPGEKKEILLAVPFYKEVPENLIFSDDKSNSQAFKNLFAQTKQFWQDKLNYIKFNLPISGKKIADTYRSNLAYILINRDNAGIQPGSRSYERSWIRDGSLTSSALLKSGIVDEVRDFIDWYSANQFENGKIPCVVDSRGPDPVPENDSHGEYLFLIKQFYNFTHDSSFLANNNLKVIKTVDYIQSMIAETLIEDIKNGSDSLRPFYGLMPESISHEGYSAKPMHSYWDDFFTLRGLKDAVDIEAILKDEKEYLRFKSIRDSFRENLYNSLKLAIKIKDIDYIPGCAELGDFDATSTTIAIYPVNELPNLPEPQLSNTFNRYYNYFSNRRNGKTDWVNYTPYEVRIIGSFIFLNEPERAHNLIEYFLKAQRPYGWNAWAEVVWRDEKYPGYIGDMPHTWVGSDFINAVRAMFVYENDYDTSLVIGAALYEDWINASGGMSIEHLPTYYGELSYNIIKSDDHYSLNLYGELNLPAGNIILKNFNSSKMPLKVFINGTESKLFTNNSITINQFPAKVTILY